MHLDRFRFGNSRPFHSRLVCMSVESKSSILYKTSEGPQVSTTLYAIAPEEVGENNGVVRDPNSAIL